MSSEYKWFVAQAIFQATVHSEKGDLKPVSEELLFLVHAIDKTSAKPRAEAIARTKEHSYPNDQGQQVSWTFVRLVDVTEMIDQKFEEGAELKSTMTEAN